MQAQLRKIKEIQGILKFTYGIIPIVAGADKFTNLLTDWSAYLNAGIKSFLPVNIHVFMMIIGLVEIIAGALVFINVQKGAYLVSMWLFLIAFNLLTAGNYLDIAVRDIAMAIGAFSLAKLSGITNSKS